MKTRIICVLFLCAVLVPLAFTLSAPAQDTHRAEQTAAWEHLALSHDAPGLGGGLSQQIIRLGGDGWQLVCVTPIAEDCTTTKTIYYFKRPR